MQIVLAVEKKKEKKKEKKRSNALTILFFILYYYFVGQTLTIPSRGQFLTRNSPMQSVRIINKTKVRPAIIACQLIIDSPN